MLAKARGQRIGGALCYIEMARRPEYRIGVPAAAAKSIA
jgi:hypothetical protein